MLEEAGPRLEDARQAEQDAHDERSDAYGFYWESLGQLEYAEEDFWATDYDPTFEYVDYLNWERPDDYDAILEHLEDCNEDANQTDCVADCEYDSSYAWCYALDTCNLEVECCKHACDEGDEDCEYNCDQRGYACKTAVGYWDGDDNLECKTSTCKGQLEDNLAAYCEVGSDDYETCRETYVADYYTCIGPLDCVQRYETVCQDVCYFYHAEYNELCYGECLTAQGDCECNADNAECKAGCDEGDTGCTDQCDVDYAC